MMHRCVWRGCIDMALTADESLVGAPDGNRRIGRLPTMTRCLATIEAREQHAVGREQAVR